VKGVEESAGNQIRRPDHGRGLNEETPRNPSDREPNQLSRHDDEPLEAEVVGLTEKELASDWAKREKIHL
jgi:hypothetical protein